MPLMPISILLCTHRTNRFFGSRAGQLPLTLRKPSEGAPARARTEPWSELFEWYHPARAPSIVETAAIRAGRVRHPLDNTRVHLIVGPAISDLASLSVS